MGFNKKVLSKAVSELGKAKAPAKPRDIIVDPAGQWKYPGQETRIPGNDITMQGVPYPVWAQPNVGPGSMMQPNQDYNFPGASYVDETPMVKKGGTLQSKKYSKSMSATNKLFAKNKLFQNKKSKIFDPNAEFKTGGSKLGTINLNPNPLSHYELNYGFNLPTKEDGGESDYEDLELTDEEIQAYKDAGYEVEEAPKYEIGGYVQHELVKAQNGKTVKPLLISDPKEFAYRKAAYDDSLKMYNLGKQADKHFNLTNNSTTDEAFAINIKLHNDEREAMKDIKSKSKAKFNNVYEKQKKPVQPVSFKNGITNINYTKSKITPSKKLLEISDPKEFALRKAAYDDSLKLYNESIDDLKGMSNTKFIKAGKYTNETPQAGWSQSYINNKKDDLGNTVKGKIKPIGVNYSTRNSDNEDVVSYMYKKPVQPVKLVPKKDKPKSINTISNNTIEPISTLPLRPIQQFTSPEQTIIPGKPYVKPKQYLGPRFGTLAGDENLNLPENYTQQQREAARKKRDADEFTRKTLEYQAKQRGTKAPIAQMFQKGGENEPEYDRGVLPEATIAAEAPLWKKLNDSYETSNPYDEFFSKKKQEYIKSRPKNLTKLMGVDDNDIPESVVNSIYNEYQYNKNNDITKNLGKQKGFNPKRHSEWVENLSNKEKEIVSNSKYGENIQPSYWARSAVGVQELGNTLLPGKPFNFNISGLTEKEQQKYRDDKFAALETLAPLDIPGVAVANYMKNSNREQPNIFSGKPMANVTDLDAALLNPALITGIGGLSKGLVSAPKLIRQGSKAIGKTLGTESGLLSKVDKTIYPTRTYRAHVPGGNETRYEASELAKKINDKGDWSTKDLTEVQQYLAGTEAFGGKKGLLTGDDMLLTEYKLPFWKKNVSYDQDVTALKKLQNVDVNPNEFIIPNNKFLYPRRTNLIKAVPEELKNFEDILPSGIKINLYESGSVPLSYTSTNFASKPYRYIEDQINAVTGHDMPLTYKFKQELGWDQNIPMHDWTQKQFAPNKGSGKFNSKKLPGSPNAGVQQAGMLNPIELADKIFPKVSPYKFLTFGMPVEGAGYMTGSPLNILPFYGEKMGAAGQAFRKFGNSMDDVIKTKTLSPTGGSKFRMGKNQIVKEGNWAAPGKFDENYPGVFGAKFDPKAPGSNLDYKSIKNRNGVLVTDKVGENLPAVPLSEPGLSFHRRLPFSNRYVPINKEKLLNNKFQLGTQGGHLQSLLEKYGVGLGLATGAGALKGSDAPLKTYNKYTIDPLINAYKKHLKPIVPNLTFQKGGDVESWEDELDDDEIKALEAAGYTIERIK